MNTLLKIQRIVKCLAYEYIPKKLQSRFFAGVEALSTKELKSLNANGRSLSNNRWTGESRIRRVVEDSRFTKLILPVILEKFLPRKGRLRLSLDHSTFGCFTIAVFALSAGKGRALPVWCVITRTGKGYPLLKPLFKGFIYILRYLNHGQRKRLEIVMDRWFAIPDLLQWIDDQGLNFIVRIKADTPLVVPWIEPHRTIPAGEISHTETPVTYYGRDWRFVRSDFRPNMKEKEPWYLLTNMRPEKRTRQQILRSYAKRFELEEYFRDVKWIEGYEWHQIRHLKVIRTVFAFVFLGWWLLLRAYGENKDHPATRYIHSKKRLSWFRTAWEDWHRLQMKPLFFSG